MNTEAVPKKILELMNVPGLTRENVASHLQVCYLYFRNRNLTDFDFFELRKSFLSFSSKPLLPLKLDY